MFDGLEHGQLAKAIVRALLGGVPKLKLGPDENKLIICWRSRGQVIEDPECDFDFEAQASGIFRRYPQPDKAPRWLWFSSTDDLPSVLSLYLKDLAPLEMEVMSMDCTWQSIQAAENREKAARRQRKTGKPPWSQGSS